MSAIAIDPGKAEEGKVWFSVREAAEYLGISIPTVFRWMKSGMLSFYKVGNSTRFSQESLDALVKKTTGQTEAEAARGRCASCGHAVLVEGRLQGTGRLYFRPEGVSFWTLAEAVAETIAKTCAACGYIQLHADTAKIAKLRPDLKGR